jgi:hypothetical protein
MAQSGIVECSVIDVIHAAFASNIGQTKALEIWRELGGEIRDIDFAAQWRIERERFASWRKQQVQS